MFSPEVNCCLYSPLSPKAAGNTGFGLMDILYFTEIFIIQKEPQVIDQNLTISIYIKPFPL